MWETQPPLRLTKPELISIEGATPQRMSPAQSVFSMWAEGNGLPLHFVSREAWQERQADTPHFLKITYESGKRMRELTLPQDIQLWEVPSLLRELDKELSWRSKLPPLAMGGRTEITEDNYPHREEVLKHLGSLLHNSAIYLAKNLDQALPKRAGFIFPQKQNERPREIAERLAQDFYSYGTSLLEEKPMEEIDIKTIKDQGYTGQETQTREEIEEAVGRFLLGDRVYENRKKRERSTPHRVMASFFRTIARVEHSSHHSRFLSKIQDRTRDVEDIPLSQVSFSLLDQGMEYLRGNMTNLWGEKVETLRASLRIVEMKKSQVLDRADGKSKQYIAMRQQDNIQKIQEAISSIQYGKNHPDLPVEIDGSNTIQCVGASLLGSTFLSEMGIPHLVIDTPTHSSFLAVLEDDSVMWVDMLGRGQYTNNIELTQGSLAEIVAFARHPDQRANLPFHPTPQTITNAIGDKINAGYLVLMEPSAGIAAQILDNKALGLMNLGMNEEALAAYEQVLAINPQYAKTYRNKGILLSKMGRFYEALATYRKYLELGLGHDQQEEEVRGYIHEIEERIHAPALSKIA